MLCVVWWAAALWALWARGALVAAQEPRPLCPLDNERCETLFSSENQGFQFEVNGVEVTYEFMEGDHFTLKCPRNIALDEPALPRFQPALRVREVYLACPPPATSYAAALRDLNVIALDSAGPGDSLAPSYLINLELSGPRSFDPVVLATMQSLRNLRITRATVTAANLMLLPAGIELLELINTKIGRLPAAVLARLPHLGELRVEDKEAVAVEVESAANLSSLVITSFAGALVSLTLPVALERLKLSGWTPRHPVPWHSCAGLDSLQVLLPTAETLPVGWLARCARLRSLRLIRAVNLKTMATGALRGATKLEELTLTRCALEVLPAGLLDDTPALRVLDLSGNFLHTLPGDLLRSSKSLFELNLSRNNLSSSALGVLRAVATLSELRLESNIALDACPLAHDGEHKTMQGSSPFLDLQNLTRLTVQGTATRRVCADWRRLPRLRELGLSYNPITRLTYADLQFNTTVAIKVYMSATNVTALAVSREDYESAAAAPPGPMLSLLLTTPLRCDCEMYWAAGALRLPNTRLRLYGTLCTDGRELRNVPLDELLCAAPGPCPAGCTCETRGDAARPGPLLRVVCTGTELRRVPRVDARATLRYTRTEPVALDLRLANNSIDRLGPEDLPPELTALDLRNNSLGLIDAATTAALVSRADRWVLLAGNPLECSCHAAAALAAVRAHTYMFRDWADATCANGTALTLSAPLPCDVSEGSTPHSEQKDVSRGMSAGPVAALTLGVAVLALVIVLGLVLARPLLRRRLRAAMWARAPSILRLERPDAGVWLYDAFVSFAHADEAVARELVERLEDGPSPLRLCVHYRDWMPGGWIPAQIAASVRVSRRTVVIVSDAFMRSKWARAEFREAYAAAVEDNEPRLVLVLLVDPARLQLDIELRAYVSGNTYVRWGDPYFWQKLRRSLPSSAPRTTTAPGTTQDPVAVPALETAPAPGTAPASEIVPAPGTAPASDATLTSGDATVPGTALASEIVPTPSSSPVSETTPAPGTALALEIVPAQDTAPAPGATPACNATPATAIALASEIVQAPGNAPASETALNPDTTLVRGPHRTEAATVRAGRDAWPGQDIH